MPIALMCAEADPLNCHRGLLISRELVRANISVKHIHQDGQLEDHCSAEQRLLELVGAAQVEELYRPREDALAEAYARQEARVAFMASPTDSSVS